MRGAADLLASWFFLVVGVSVLLLLLGLGLWVVIFVAARVFRRIGRAAKDQGVL